MLREFIEKLMRKENLSAEEVESALAEIVTGENEGQIAAFLTLLRAKNETTEEVYGLVSAMRSMMVKVKTRYPTLDIVGTGGDGFNTINISTGSALLAASCGVKIAKHGNRSVSSMSGSADVLESMGINIDLCPDDVLKCMELYNFSFLYAPNFHPALKKIKAIRKRLGVPTVFNLVGPLLNPAEAQFLMIGVSDQYYLKIISDILIRLGVQRALVFNCLGLDEICCVGPIEIIEINNLESCRYTLHPEDYGFNRCAIESLQGGAAGKNAEIIKSALKGNSSPVSDTLILNAGLANYLYGLCGTVEEGIALAKCVHAKGDAYKLIKRLAKGVTEFSGVSNA